MQQLRHCHGAQDKDAVAQERPRACWASRQPSHGHIREIRSGSSGGTVTGMMSAASTPDVMAWG